MAAVTPKKEVLEFSGYLRGMSSRLQSLQNTANQISTRIDQFATNIRDAKGRVVRDKEVVKKELASVKEDVRSIQKATLEIINHLKNSVKADEFERFRKRMDLWAPEKFVTRREAKRVLEET